jgi:outer membrane protein assembly factor BamB
MNRFGPLAALAAAAALSACSTVSHLNPFGESAPPAATAPEEGRISILAFEQQLTPDPALAGRTIVTPPAQAIEWTQPGGTADNSPVHVDGSARLHVQSRVGLGAGSDNNVRIAAPPVIGEGKLFFVDADHRVHAIDATTGNSLWSRELRPTGDSNDHRARAGGVAYSSGRVFVTTGFGFAVALNAADGQEVWRANVGAPFHAAPTVSGTRVYAVTNDNELIALDSGTGAQLWSYQAIAESARILAASSPAVEGDSVIAPFASGELVSLLNANGRRLWSDALSRSGRLTSLSAINDIAGRPAIEGGIVYAASHSGVLAAIDMRTGQRIWARGFASTQTPWIAGDTLYAVTVDGELAAFDRETGGVLWLRQLRRFQDEHDREGRIAWTGPILVGGKLVLANSVGEVVAVSPETGEVQATRDLHTPIFIPPIASGGKIYIVTDEAKLIILD